MGTRPTTVTVLSVAALALVAVAPARDQPRGGTDTERFVGGVTLIGSATIDGIGGDGKPFTSVEQVQSAEIGADVLIRPNGEVDAGTMSVSIRWTKNGTYSTGDGQQDGVLDITGDLRHFEATGALTWQMEVRDSKGNLLDDVGDPRPTDVTWQFDTTENTCNHIIAPVTASLGISTMNYAALPRMFVSSGSTTHSDIEAVLILHPEGQSAFDDDLTDLQLEIAQSIELWNDALGDPDLSIQEVVFSLRNANLLREKILALGNCAAVLGDLANYSTWLTPYIQQFLEIALEQVDELDPEHLLQLVGIGLAAGSIAASGDGTAAELWASLGVELDRMLNDAIEAGEWDTVIDIAVGAGHYGYIDIHDHGAAAYEEHKADEGGGG